MRRRATIDIALPILRDEDACLDVFFRWRWPRGFTCPHCGHRHASRVGGRRAWRCRGCRRQIHVTAGTIMHGSHLPLRIWLYAIAMVGGRKQSISAMQLAKDTGVAYSSAWSLLHRIRRALHDKNLRKLSRGVVEVTVRDIGQRDARTYGAPAWWSGAPRLAIAIERNFPCDGRLEDELRFGGLRASVLPADAPLLPFVRWASKQQNPDTFPHAVGLTVMGNLIDWIRGTFHGVSVKYLQAYLDEAMFRFDRRRREDLLPLFVGRRVLSTARFSRKALLDPPRPVEVQPDSAAPTNDETAALPDEARALSPVSRAELARLLALPVSGLNETQWVDDFELLLVVKALRRDLPVRLRKQSA
jgi:transposase-like protein